MHPVVRFNSDGKEMLCMGHVFPLWPEMKDFLTTLETTDRFWKLASMLQGWDGLNRLDRRVSERTRL